MVDLTMCPFLQPCGGFNLMGSPWWIYPGDFGAHGGFKHVPLQSLSKNKSLI
jgi:hypothetical protein